MNNQISNHKVEVPNGTGLNDKDYITSLILCLKEMSKNYVIAMTEASNEALYEKYSIIFNQIINLQRETYEVMFRKGWYTLEKVEKQKLDTKYQNLNQELMDLSA